MRKLLKKILKVIQTIEVSSFLLFSGATVFMVLGHISDYLRVDFKDVVNSGPALAFVSYPFAIAKAFGPSPVGLVVAIIVSMLFFLMLFCVGIGSVATITDSIVANIHKNLFPKIWLWLLKAIVCFFLFIGGIFQILGQNCV